MVVDARSPEAASIVLMQAGWSVLLTARGSEAFHGGVVARNGAALAIAGASGSGKSTAVLTLLDAGWKLVADDLLRVDECDRAIPGPPFVRLTSDRALHRVGEWDASGKLRYWPPCVSESIPLKGIVVHGDQFATVERIGGARAVGGLLSNVYNDLLTHDGQAKRRFDLALSLAQRLPIFGAPPRSLTLEQLEQIASEGAGIP